MTTPIIESHNSCNFGDILINGCATLYFNFIFYHAGGALYIVPEATWINPVPDPLHLSLQFSLRSCHVR
jgi:hypothetical protein